MSVRIVFLSVLLSLAARNAAAATATTGSPGGTQYLNVSITGTTQTVASGTLATCFVTNSTTGSGPFFPVVTSAGATCTCVTNGVTATCTATVLNLVSSSLFICVTDVSSATTCTSSFSVSNAVTIANQIAATAIYNKTITSFSFTSHSLVNTNGATVTVSSTNASINALSGTGFTCGASSVGTGSSFSMNFAGGSLSLQNCVFTSSSASAYYVCVTDTYLNQFACSNAIFVSNAVVTWSTQASANPQANVPVTGTVTTTGSSSNSYTLTASLSNTTYSSITPSTTGFSCSSYSAVFSSGSNSISGNGCVFKTVGTYYLCARDTYGNSAVSCSNAIIVIPASPSQITVSASPTTSVTTSTAVSISFTIVDAYANTVTSNTNSIAFFATLNATSKVNANVLSCATPTSLTSSLVAGAYTASGCKISTAGTFYLVVNDTSQNVLYSSAGALTVASTPVTPSASGASYTAVPVTLIAMLFLAIVA